MDFLTQISEFFGQEVTFQLNGQFFRCGKNNRFWAIGKEWTYNEKTYQTVTYGDYKTGSRFKLNSWNENELTTQEQRSIRNRTKEINEKLQLEKQKAHQETADQYKQLFNDPKNFSTSLHPYLSEKKIDNPYGSLSCKISNDDLGIYPETLLIPIYNKERKIAGAQRIYKKQNSFIKKYASGTEMIGSYFNIGDIFNAETVILCEGFATGASIYMATKKPVMIAFQANNLTQAAKTLRFHNPKCQIIVAADNDKSSGEGEKQAKLVLQELDRVIIRVVNFPNADSEKLSDFNDLHTSSSLQEVRNQLTINFEKEQFKNDVKDGFTYTDEKTGKYVRNFLRLQLYFSQVTNYKYCPEIKQFFIYNGAFYIPTTEQEIKSFAQEFFSNPVCTKEGERMEFLHLCKAKNHISLDFFDSNKGLINFKNHIYDFKNKKIIPHSPEYGFRSIIPWDHNTEAKCPTWDKLMRNVTGSRKHLIDIIEEFIGFSMSGMPYSEINKALILEGAGRNGKTTIINIIRELLGTGNASAIEMGQIGRDKFAAVSLDGKMLAVCEEEEKSVFKSSGQFKKLTGGSPMIVQQKGKPAYEIINNAKILMSYNERPQLGDLSKGMLSRLMVIPFDQDVTKKENKIDNLKERLPGDYSGIINRAIAGLDRLLKNGNFTEAPETKKIVEEMVLESDPYSDFISEKIQILDDASRYVESKDLYAAFIEFSGENESIRVVNKKLLKALSERSGYIKTFVAKQNGRSIRCVSSICLT